MAAEPLIDLKSIDLTQTVADKPALLEVLKQRNRFEMCDGVVHMDLEEGVIVGFKDVKADDWWVDDHIPGRPLFPGALMVEATAQVCTYHFLNLRQDLEGQFVGFGGVDKVRFRAAVEPGCRMWLIGKVVRVRSRMFTYKAQIFVGETLVFEGEILGVVV
ncbi:MAG: 3-hydroxyacyl-ACP dehydratase FabZ family protein [Planctomycetota bacterium]